MIAAEGRRLGVCDGTRLGKFDVAILGGLRVGKAGP